MSEQFRTIDGELMGFRTAWLRSIARAWGDEAFEKRLKKDAITAMQDEFGFKWPWPNLIAFNVNTEQQLRWAGDDWVWPNDKEDSLILYLPIKKARPPEEEQAAALAAYYADRPSIFGNAGGGGATPRGAALVTSAGLDVTDAGGLPISNFILSNAPVRFAGNSPPPGGFTPNGGSFLDFEVVLMSALAKAWNNEAFAQLIQSDQSTLAIALQTIRGFSSPWRLTLKVLDDQKATWDGKSWSKLSPHLLSLNLPDRPPAIHERGVALAAYNSTGAEFPFTCCA